MKILSAEQVRAWDQYTMQQEPISSLDLMERAAGKCFSWLQENRLTGRPFFICCGKGNNGGDGLVIARLLSEAGHTVSVFILEFGHKGTEDFQANLARLHQINTADIRFIQTAAHLPPIPPDTIIIDALFGTGLNRRAEGVTAELIAHINQANVTVISIDLPSGLFADRSSKENPVIHAMHTLAFECYKPAFVMAENAAALGEVHILDIGLSPAFYDAAETSAELIDGALVRSIYRPRKRFGHKGDFGHALIIAGSYGKTGAAVLSVKACLHSGPGLVSCHVPRSAYEIMQGSIPEAMVLTDYNSSFNTKLEEDPAKFRAIGIGPGLGTSSETASLVKQMLEQTEKPLVLDADALNILAAHPDWLTLLPETSLLTPHPKEFSRLFGDTANEFERNILALHKARELGVVIILKGHHTLVATPGGMGFYNSTGNAGMASGGSGDVLTGILTGLLAQGYSPVETAILGVYLHGLAGDLAAAELSKEAMAAGDIITYLGKAFLQINNL